MPRVRIVCAAALLALLPLTHASADVQVPTSTQRLDVRSPAQIVRDVDGIQHVFARSETDMAYLQGYAHARDRLFQMDVSRRMAEGTLAELLGRPALPNDVMFRTLGLRRAAERSLPLQTRELRAVLTAYAAGVNAWASANPLPPEYGPLELTSFRPWTETDSLTVSKLATFPNVGLDDIERTLRFAAYQSAGASQGFDATKLFFGDVERAAPFDPASAVPDAQQAPVRRPRGKSSGPNGMDARPLDGAALGLARDFLERLRQAPLASRLLGGDNDRGSNAWVVSGR